MKKRLLILVLCIATFVLASCAAPSVDHAPQPTGAPSIGAPLEEYEDSAPVTPAETPEEPPAEIMDEAPLPAPVAPAAPSDAEGSGMLDDTTESYIPIDENNERPTDSDSLVTFSLKVDTASYSNTKRYIDSGSLPPADAVKVEELINYFNYDTPVDFQGDPLGIYTEIGQSPFDASKYMAFIRVKAQDIEKSELPPSSLTFLIDTSGSMDTYDKLPLLKESFALLADTLGPQDRISIVTYADSSAVVLNGATGRDKNKILSAIYNLEAGGSTAGADGIWTAYQLAAKNFIDGGNNRVILATDGDFNVGISDIGELSDFISTKRDSGVYLSTLGFGTGNLRDDIMETLAKDGNGNYSYIDSKKTAEKVLVDELGSNLFTIADDVKAQVEFNPANVKSYRLVGYENRQLANEDFEDDAKDAGEIGVGTDVVALFELELANPGNGSQLKYSEGASPAPRQTDFGQYGNELFEVRVRYKYPGQSDSQLILNPVTFDSIKTDTSPDFNFACSVAEFGNQLRQSPYAAYAAPQDVFSIAADNLGQDIGGYRTEHLLTLKHWQDTLDDWNHIGE